MVNKDPKIVKESWTIIMANKKINYSFLVFFFSILILIGCTRPNENLESSTLEKIPTSEETSLDDPVNIEELPVVTLTMENGEEIHIELYPSIAPNTVSNFISLAEEGFYNGLVFHRVIPGFMIQGGDPEGSGTGGPGYSIAGEFSANGFENELKHERGVVSMARSQSPNSAGSQFFIMVADSQQLDSQYATFGKVVTGMETVDSIVSVERDDRDKPLTDQTIKEVVVDTKGFDYPTPDIKK